MKETGRGMIPQPRTYGPLGNLPLIDMNKPTLSLGKLADKLGPIYRLTAPGYTSLILSGHELVKEVCDTGRFDKHVYSELENLRALGGDGLFTSWTNEPNWRKAHNILLPTFGKQAMKGYHGMMLDIAQQLVQKWARLNPNESVDVPDDMTRLTLDTIGLCGFNYRFNSFYRENHNPFVISMVRALNEAMLKSSRLGIQNLLMVKTRRQFEADIQTMFTLVDRIIEERKASGTGEETDLLARMLNGQDPETGEKLDDENVRYQIITFLIAGHETTSGLLSFAIYFLLKNPEALRKAYEEADRVLTGPVPTYEQVLQLDYIRLVLNESLRLWPTAPGFDLYAKEDTVIGGQYPLKKGESVSVLLPQLHRDKEAWGEDAELFRPERFADPSKVPHHAYKPFGNGERACIGMQFALYEATLVLGMILKHFELEDHLSYELDVRQTLTLKPGDFRIRVKPRIGKQAPAAFYEGTEGMGPTMNAERMARERNAPQSDAAAGAENSPLLVLYGSNLGTAEGIARGLADTARKYGLNSEVGALNDWAGKLPQEGAVLIVTSSYNGKPPHNAAEFVQWLHGASAGDLSGVRYAVLGCGDRNWSNTYQSVPIWIDEQMARKGAVRLAQRGEADAGGDFEKSVDEWRKSMWQHLAQALGLSPEGKTESMQDLGGLDIQFVADDAISPIARMYDAVYARTGVNRELQAPGSGRSTRHIELLLPEGLAYREGDHLGVLPTNSAANVDRVLRRFRLRGGERVVLSAGGGRQVHLPLEYPVDLRELLKHCVELQEPATRAQLRALASWTVCPPHKRELERMLEEETYLRDILGKRVSMLDLLEQYEACELPFGAFLELLPPLKPRYYSISSSPADQPSQASLTVAVVHAPAWSGRGQYRGVASGYLAGLDAGDEVLMFTRTPGSGFRLPDDPSVPIVMVGPGTGIAPFRGFLQARAALKRQGASLGEAHLFFGCRNEADYLYREELEAYAQDGIVTLHTAFSRKEGQPLCYVQHLLDKHAEALMDLFARDGRLYVCGDGSKMAPEVEETLQLAYSRVYRTDVQDAMRWFNRLEEEGRYAKDVWANGTSGIRQGENLSYHL
ncbi:cytochrome P450/NADPH-cytochrome P450 reductase [Paenibacillus phyllosphaerae]|uniref:Bifunctional cytochrome P450/NADPH--P450 reductase n=1 Tax=Paenibacillus phyllosphaerae TaxID=274593 RepID=A0A7W5B281_9BACL|nr:cytochrome P450 [Paenibacillus phyllosphaerae]MBB3112501.1 cytochrome P450/NADPH-cytochrome P450 reductase [Paenibacillus phyllosphaerae]